MVFSTRAFFLSALASALAEGPGKPSQCPRYRDEVFIGANVDNFVTHGESQVGVAKTISEQKHFFILLKAANIQASSFENDFNSSVGFLKTIFPPAVGGSSHKEVSNCAEAVLSTDSVKEVQTVVEILMQTRYPNFKGKYIWIPNILQ